MENSDKKIIGIFSSPWRSTINEKSLLGMYRKAVWFKANPRSEDYMKALFLAHYPQGLFINVDNNAAWFREIPSASELVMLYPDSIGIGFRIIDSKVFKRMKKGVPVYVLNGRKRKFLFKANTRLQLYLRRFAEHYMVGEILMILLFLIVTLFFFFVDLVKRRI